MSKCSAATVAAGLGLLIPAFVGLLSGGNLCPLPMLTVLPAILLGLGIAAIMVPTLLFFIWNPGLFRGDPTVPTRSYVLTAVLAVLSVIYFVTSWSAGVHYQGMENTRTLCLVNILSVISLALGFSGVRKVGPSFKYNLLVHWMLFAWLSWYAFPWLGELP